RRTLHRPREPRRALGRTLPGPPDAGPPQPGRLRLRRPPAANPNGPDLRGGVHRGVLPRRRRYLPLARHRIAVMMPAVQTEALCERYRSTVAVRSLDLQVARGTVFGFLGANGAGKTTTIMMLLGNVRPTAGRAWLLGRRVGDMEIRRRIGFLPEKFQFHDF